MAWVGFVISDFKFAVWTVFGIRLVVETTVGKRAAKPLVEEQQQERHLHAFSGQLVRIARTITFQEAMPFQFA